MTSSERGIAIGVACMALALAGLWLLPRPPEVSPTPVVTGPAVELDVGAPADVAQVVPPPPVSAVGPAPVRPNVVLITVDTVRADHLSTYGYARETSPGLTRLAENGVVFTHAYANASWTLPSVASTLSGVLPSEHGVLNAQMLPDGGATADALPDGVPSLPGALAAAGYRTEAVTANGHLLPSHGFARGFDAYEHLGFRDADVLEPAVLARLPALLEGEQPFFLWVHVLDPHAPYAPPDADRALFWDGPPIEALDALGAPEWIALALHRPPHVDEIEYLVAAYDGEIHRADALVERLLAAVSAEPYVALITSDHGEEFLEHGGMGHGNTLFDEQVRIPLVLIAPGYLTRTEVATPVSLVDVLPTLLDLAGAPAQTGVAGLSLTPLLRGEPLRARDIVLESGRNEIVVRAIVADGMKYGYMLTPTPLEALFDLAADSRELSDLMPMHTALGRTLRRRLDDALDAAAARRPALTEPAPTISPEDVERLRALGYAPH